MGSRDIPHPEFWDRFVETDPTAISRFHDVRRSGETRASADEAAQLILAGRKTATISLRAQQEASGYSLPEAGALSIVEDGSGRPVAVVEITEVVVQPLADIDDSLTRACGEWGGSLKSWRRQCRAIYAPQCRSFGQPFSEETELVCERFRVVFTDVEALTDQMPGHAEKLL